MAQIITVLNGFNFLSVTFRILLAVLMGGTIGSERGRHGRAAGLRTHILVCLGSTMTALLGMYGVVVLGFSGDPLRVGAQVISGIGFLGAGTILTRNHSQVLGLTTAAGLWATASLGLAIGIGFYWGAAVGYGVIMVTITILTKLERSSKQPPADTYYLEVNDVTRVNDFSQEMAPYLSHLQIIPARSGIAGHVGLEFYINGVEDSEELLERFRALEYTVIAVPISH